MLSKLVFSLPVLASQQIPRRLLQTSFLPPITQRQYCDVTDTCDISQLSDGVSGIVLEGEAKGDGSGFSVGTAGDINGDGIDDLLVGAYNADPSGNANAGKTYILFGSNISTAWGTGILNLSSFTDGQRGFVLHGEMVGDQSGSSVSTAGDINGDGLADFMVAARYALSNKGKTYVIFGSNSSTAWGDGILNISSLMNGQRGFVLHGEAANDVSGSSVSTAGDINGDGLADLMVAAYNVNSQMGKTYVIFGSNNSTAWGDGILNISSLTNGQRGFSLRGEFVNDVSGSSVSTAGDINGDGLADFMVGAFKADLPGNADAGKTYILFGSNISTAWGTGILNLSSFTDGQKGFVLHGEAATDQSGSSVSTAGDINGDGLTDFMVGANNADPPGNANAGKTYVIFGSNISTAWGTGILNLSSFIDGQRGFVLHGEVTNGQSGSSVSTAGDINGDGLADLVVGAGKTYVVLGSSRSGAWGTGILNFMQHGFALQGAALSCVSTAGDINGDGFADLLLGASNADPSGRQDAGKTYILFGSNPNSTQWNFTANNLNIGVGQTVQLTLGNMNLSSLNNENLNDTYFTLHNLSHGVFTLKDNPIFTLTNFSLRNISEGAIQFVHDGSLNAPQYGLSVKNSSQKIRLQWIFYSDAQIGFIGYVPKLVNNQLTVNQGLSSLVQVSDLSVIDEDNVASDLFFVISNLTYGQFMAHNASTNTSTPTTIFSQQAVLDGQIHFLHNGSPNKPSYFVTVDDTNSTTNPRAATVTFNYEPVIFISTPMILDQGQGTTLTPRMISASDRETFRESLIFETNNASGGYFAYASNLNESIVSFQQLSVITGAVQFVQDGSASKPSFALRAHDGFLYSPWQSPPLVQLNRRPLMVHSLTDQIVTQGEEFSFTLPTVFRDPDGDILRLTAYLQGGTPLPKDIQFTPPGQFSGNLPSVGSFTIAIEASDYRGITAVTPFVLSSQESQAAYYRAVYSSVSGLVGTGVGVLLYLWLRRRIAKHRRDFSFANDLRKVLNLEYYDFTRFDGDAYKTKIDNFLVRLQLEHAEFYSQLAPEQRKNFAVCVGEILTERGLISRSGYGGGLFGILCCINVGWPSQLNLKAFEAQSLDIAAEAVTAWRTAATAEKVYQTPLARWPYYSPDTKEKIRVFCCRAKPASADRWRILDSQGVALPELKKFEGTDSEAGRKPASEFETRMLFLEEQNRLMLEQVTIIKEENKAMREENAIMAVTIKTLQS